MTTPQQGGKIEAFKVFLMNLDSPAKLIYGFILILTIVYSPLIPTEYRIFANSLLGKIFGIAIVYGVIESLGWIYGLLTAFSFLLILNGVSHVESVEAFDGGGSISEKKAVGNRWFVEQVLGERPKKIATDRVITSAVDD